jgi:hypothetical protein
LVFDGPGAFFYAGATALVTRRLDLDHSVADAGRTGNRSVKTTRQSCCSPLLTAYWPLLQRSSEERGGSDSPSKWSIVLVNSPTIARIIP